MSKYILLALHFLNVWAFAFWGPLLTAYALYLGANPSLAGSLYAFYTLAQGCMFLFFGKIESPSNRWGMLVTGYILQGLCAILFWLVVNPRYLFFPLAVSAIAGGMIAPNWKALYMYVLAKGKEGAGWSYFDAGGAVMIALGAFFAGMLANRFGFRSIFIPLFLLNFVAVFLAIYNKAEIENIRPAQ